MAKVETRYLTGQALDWAVTLASGLRASVVDGIVYLTSWLDEPLRSFNPSSNWTWSGPIIEREHILPDWLGCEWCARKLEAGRPFAENADVYPILTTHITYGPTPLVAAMRCYVASKLGDEVEILEELL